MCSPEKESGNFRNFMWGLWVYKAMHGSFTVYVAILSKILSVLLRKKALAFERRVCV